MSMPDDKTFEYHLRTLILPLHQQKAEAVIEPCKDQHHQGCTCTPVTSEQALPRLTELTLSD